MNQKAEMGQPASFLAVAVLALAVVAISVPRWHRSFWLDEAWVVDFALRESLTSTLSDTIAWRQPAAAGYMAMIHWLAPAGLAWPPAFRLPSAVVTFLTMLVLCRYVAKLWNSAAAGLFVTLGVMVAWPLQHYATEVKQYAIDVLVTVVMLSATRMCHDRDGDTRSLACWGAGALLGSLMSFAGMFAFVGSFLVLSGDFLARRQSQNAARVAWASLPAFVVFGLHYILYIRPISQSPGLNAYWQDYFPKWSPSLPRDQAVLLYGTVSLAWANHAVVRPWAVMGAAALGWLVWLRRDRAGALCALATVLLTVTACMTHKWPMGARAARVNQHVIVIVSASALLLGPAAIHGLVHLVSRRRGGDRASWPRLVPVSHACLWLLAAAAGGVLLRDCFRPYPAEPRAIGLLLDEAARRAEPDDTIAMDYTARVNQRVSPRPFRAKLVAADPTRLRFRPESVLAVIDQISPSLQGRLYILVSHDHERFQPEIRKRVAEAGIGEERFRLAWRGKDVGLYVYEKIP